MALFLGLCLLLAIPTSLLGARSGIQCPSCGAFIGLEEAEGARHLRTTHRTVGWCFTVGYLAFIVVGFSGLQRVVLWAEGPMVTIRSGDAQRTVSAAVGRDLLQTKCARCHSLKPVYLYRKPEEEWRLTVARMRAKDLGLTSECQADSIVGYLASELGPVT